MGAERILRPSIAETIAGGRPDDWRTDKIRQLATPLADFTVGDVEAAIDYLEAQEQEEDR